MICVKEGQKAPLFSLPASNGKTVTLKDFRDKKNVVLYFYPKDDTPGCTTEACGFRDRFETIKKTGAAILGVSPDSLKKHEKFVEKYELPFLLLSDEDKALCEKYGVWVEKSMYGRKYMGVARATFVIDRGGRVVKKFCKVRPREHAEEVFEVLKGL